MLAELNKISENIKFTVEEEVNKAMLFFGCLITRTNDIQLKTSVYKKKTNTDRFLIFFQTIHYYTLSQYPT